MSRSTADPAPASPCTGVCVIDGDGTCRGCRRTLAEIAEWGAASPDRQRAILAAVARRPAR